MIAMLREPTSEAVCVPALRSAGGSAGGEAECSGGASSAKFAAEGSGEGVLAHPAGSPWRISIPAPRTGRKNRALGASDVVVTPGPGIEKRLFGATLLYFPGTVTVEGCEASREHTALSDVSLGSLVRVVGRRELEAALSAPTPDHRPEPAQFAYADRVARVMGVRFDRERNPLYQLKGMPGLWREAWLRRVYLDSVPPRSP